MADAPVTAVAKAMAHPVRERILRSLMEADATITELAHRLQVPPSSVRYHVRMLVRLECIEPFDDLRPGRPTRYRALVRPILWDDDAAHFPRTVRLAIDQTTIDSILADYGEAVEAELLDERLDRHISRLPARFDEQAWGELVVELSDLLRRALRKVDESEARLAEGNTGGGPVQATLALMLFPAEKRPER